MEEGDEKFDVKEEELECLGHGFYCLEFPGHQEVDIKVIMPSYKLVQIMYTMFFRS